MMIGRERTIMSEARVLITGLALLILVMAHPCFSEDLSVEQWRNADPQVQEYALSLARRAFNSYTLRHEIIEPPPTLPPLLRQRSGVFVSTMRNGAPRCCMGTLYPVESSTAREIIANAVAAAGHDHRFPPIKPGELSHLTLIVSIVGRPHPISLAQAAGLDPTRDGLAVKAGNRYGVVLSGETGEISRMLQWGRIRAGASPSTLVELFRLDVVRFVEKC